jgi:hypothetical protein
VSAAPRVRIGKFRYVIQVDDQRRGQAESDAQKRERFVRIRRKIKKSLTKIKSQQSGSKFSIFGCRVVEQSGARILVYQKAKGRLGHVIDVVLNAFD